MNDRLPKMLHWDRYHVSPDDVVETLLHCKPGEIQPGVVISPIWGADVFAHHADKVVTLVPDSVWELRCGDAAVTLIQSGIGAARVGDLVLALGCTPCRTLVFTGSAGGLDAAMRIGDLMLVEKAICGEGFSRYLAPQAAPPDRLLATAAAHPAMVQQHAASIVSAACTRATVPLHRGVVFSIDSILLQFFRMNWLAGQDSCIGLDMETSAALFAATYAGIRAGAVLQVSDVWPNRKSFFSTTSGEERELRRKIRNETLAEAVLQLATEMAAAE